MSHGDNRRRPFHAGGSAGWSSPCAEDGPAQGGNDEAPYSWRELERMFRNLSPLEGVAQWIYDGRCGAARKEWSLIETSDISVDRLNQLLQLAGGKLQRDAGSHLAPERLIGRSATTTECWLNAIRHHRLHCELTCTDFRYEEGRIENLPLASASLCELLAHKTARRGKN